MDTVSPAKFQLLLLGRFALSGPEGPIELAGKKLSALLAFLASTAPQAHARDKLMTLLWGSHFDAQAQQNLRQALARLRRVLGSEALISTGKSISLKPGVIASDVMRFEALLVDGSRGALNEAIDLYRGPLLPDITIPEEAWTDWLDVRRQRLEDLALDAMIRFGDEELRLGNHRQALTAGNRAIAITRHREDAHRLVMRALAAGGRRADALKHYQDLVTSLKRELNTEPDAATTILVADLGKRQSPSSLPAEPGPRQQPSSDPTAEVGEKPTARGDVASAAVGVRIADPERRQLTIMVCMLVASTLLSADLDPEEMSERIAAFYKVVTDVAVRFGGFVAQYLGDSVHIYFGYPAAQEHDAERAVRAGLALVDAIGALSAASGVNLGGRAGIATGLVVIGENTGNGNTQQRIAIGEAPNLSARLQAVAAPGEVVIAGSTRRLVGSMFDCHALGADELKGLPQHVAAWRVLGERPGVSRFEARRAGALTPLVGRQEELDLLSRRWDQAKAGEGRVVLLSGEPGIGKSRVAETLLKRIEGGAAECLRYSCSPHHAHSPLHPFIAQLARAAGFEPGDSAAAKLDKLEASLEPTVSNAPRDLALIADLLSISTTGRYPVMEVSPQRKREMTLSALLHHLGGMATRRPVLIVFEDAHWVDPTSLDLLDRLIDSIAQLPVLMVVTFRPEFKPAWIGLPHVTMVPLGRLGRRDSAGIIGSIAQGKTLPSVAIQQILAHTDGIPLFIEELTIALLEGGYLREAANGFVLDGPLSSLAIPATLQASLLARLDRLAPVKDIAQVGAVIGREFSFGLIAAVTAMSKQELEAALGRLVAAELIFQRGTPPDAVYRFKHALVQDAAYASLLLTRRRVLHATVVRELVGASDTEVRPELLAHHCAEAGMAEEAVRHYLKASEQAVARSALTEAAMLLEKALGTVAQLPYGPPRDRMELEVQSARGPVLIAVKGFAAAETEQVYARAKEIWDRLGRPPEFLLKTARVRWSLHTNRSQFREAHSVVEDLLEFGRAHDDTVGLILGYFTRGLTHSYQGELESARVSLEEVISRRIDLTTHRQVLRYAGTDPQAIALAVAARVLLFLGYPDQAFTRGEAARMRARQSAHAPTVAQCLAFDAAQASALGDGTRLAHCVQDLRALTQEHGYPQWSALVPIFEGQLQLIRGEARAAVTLIRQGLEARRANGVTLFNANFAIALAEALEKEGKLGEALTLLDEEIAFVDATGEFWCAAGLHRLRGQLLLKCSVPDFAEAQAEFLEAIDIARQQSAKLWELRAAVSLAQLWRDHGRTADAHHLLGPTYAWFTEGFGIADLKAARLLLDELRL